jgi:multidrug efflux pump subunit AcrA (membrane-fusion protein)
MPNQRDNIRSEAVQDILSKMPHWMILWGNSIIFLLVVLFFVVSWFIKYPDIIETEAIITSQVPPQKEYAVSSGKISRILVDNFELVSEGMPLAMIENSSKLEDVLLLDKIIDTIRINSSSFNFPLDTISTLSLGEIASSYAIFEKDYINYKLDESLDPFANQISANLLSEQQLKSRLKSLQEQKELDKRSLELTQNDLERQKKLYDKGVISLNAFESKQIEQLRAEKNLQNLDITISQLKQSLNDAIKTSKETNINNQIEDTRLFKNSVQSFIQLKQSLKQWKQKYLLEADIDGKVSFINAWTENQNVAQGDLLFTIIPQNSQDFIAKIKAPIQNSGKIKTGQEVRIKLFNFPEEEYGSLYGIVQSMSALPNEEGLYLINVSLLNGLRTSYDITIPFKSEMRGSAEIITEDLRLIERFFYQLRGIFE